MTDQWDVIVVGAGPAGLSAAIEATRAGARVAVIDELDAPGGQIFRQLPGGFRAKAGSSLARDTAKGRPLLDEFDRLGICLLRNTTVWGCFEDRVLEVATADRSWRMAAGAVVIATGATDRPTPLPGWTLPGVFTLGGAQTLLKSQRVLPGDRIVLAGTGPLLLVVGSQLAAAGANIIAVVDAVRTRDVMRHGFALLSAPSVLRDAMSYRWTLWKRRVPWISPAALVSINGEREVEGAVVCSVDEEWRPVAGSERHLDVDTVCLGYGLLPGIDLLRLCGCAVERDEQADVWVPQRSQEFETSVPGVFAVGDGACVAGAVVAAEEGRVAGIAAARRTGRIDADAARIAMGPSQARLRGLQRFRTAIGEVYRLRPGLQELTTAGTTVCRCEEVTARVVAEAFAGGAQSLNQMKAWTRAGMGSCQARMCATSTAALAATALGRAPASLPAFTPRPPIKPVPVAALVHSSDADETTAERD